MHTCFSSVWYCEILSFQQSKCCVKSGIPGFNFFVITTSEKFHLRLTQMDESDQNIVPPIYKNQLASGAIVCKCAWKHCKLKYPYQHNKTFKKIQVKISLIWTQKSCIELAAGSVCNNIAWFTPLATRARASQKMSIKKCCYWFVFRFSFRWYSKHGSIGWSWGTNSIPNEAFLCIKFPQLHSVKYIHCKSSTFRFDDWNPIPQLIKRSEFLRKYLRRERMRIICIWPARWCYRGTAALYGMLWREVVN